MISYNNKCPNYKHDKKPIVPICMNSKCKDNSLFVSSANINNILIISLIQYKYQTFYKEIFKSTRPLIIH
ncbi:unnamed protein product [Paramecium octaurelia]|uniref:Uncharacterized protein n=1 Tax=Paramecium octaurelia TaxID=43137 RepID=A0A8S1YJW3_PAROT|nr:unnamed protein product [Paramecium octaurelia]